MLSFLMNAKSEFSFKEECYLHCTFHYFAIIKITNGRYLSGICIDWIHYLITLGLNDDKLIFNF